MGPGPTLLAAGSAIVENALNRALELDPAGRRALLEALPGPVQFTLTAPTTAQYTLDRAGDRIRVSSQPPEQPRVSLVGRPVAFAALALGDDQVLTDGRLQVLGDTDLAHQLQHALSTLNPDWEAAMARHIGDVPAHFLGKRIRDAVKWSRQAIGSMNANLEEYLHEETRSLPGRHEVNAALDDIEALDQRAGELEARINALESRDTDTPENP